MRIALLAMGSRGDVQPLLALGLGLAAAGFEVQVTVPRDLVPMVTERGLSAAAFDVDVRAAAGEGVGLEWQAEGSRGLRREAGLLRDVAHAMAEPVATGVLDTTEGADLVVSGALTFGAAVASTRHRGQRHVLALLAPTAPARRGTSTAFAALPDRSSVVNQLSSMAVAAGAYAIFKPGSDLVRQRLGMPPGSLRDYLRTAYATPALLACSPAVVPPDPAWGAQLRPTGYWLLPPPPGWTPPPDLVEFLAAGPAPVYLGFGSMMSRDPAATTRILLEALEASGRRGLLSSGWSGLSADDLPASVALVGDVPHEWLLPQTAAVVHHGGAGTTAAAVHAGVPQLVVPHVGDQPYWGRRVVQLGIGPRPVKRHELAPGPLTGLIRQLTGDPALRARAAELAEVVRGEDGVVTAVDLLSAYLRRP